LLVDTPSVPLQKKEGEDELLEYVPSVYLLNINNNKRCCGEKCGKMKTASSVNPLFLFIVSSVFFTMFRQASFVQYVILDELILCSYSFRFIFEAINAKFKNYNLLLVHNCCLTPHQFHSKKRGGR